MSSTSGPARSSMSKFLSERYVFMTGATGFVGKVLLEKILREVPTIGGIYCLMRPKSGQTTRQRLDEIFESIVFERLRRSCGASAAERSKEGNATTEAVINGNQPNGGGNSAAAASGGTNQDLFSKVIPISGDVTCPGLGISQADLLTLRSKVSVVFHSAATIRFDEPLRRSVQINVYGTQQVIDLAHRLPQLVSLVHVSTAYCNSIKTNVDELVYREPIPPERIIELTEWMDDDTLNELLPRLLNGRPSTYHYTKCLAENLMAMEGNNLPVAILRPSIITAAWRDPFPGWIDNYNGPTGYLVVSGKGVLRTMHVDGKKLCDIIPVDLVANAMLAAAWFTGTRRPVGPVVYNLTSGQLNPITWSQIRDLSTPLLIANPSMEMFRYPGSKFCASKWIHEFFLLVEHTLPAFLIDSLFKVAGYRPILQPVYQKVHRTIGALEYFTTNEWTFQNENYLMLAAEMDPEDRERFFLDIRLIPWFMYMESYVLGVRRYLLKEDPETIPEARRKLTQIYLLTQMLKLTAFSASFYVGYSNRRLLTDLGRRAAALFRPVSSSSSSISPSSSTRNTITKK